MKSFDQAGNTVTFGAKRVVIQEGHKGASIFVIKRGKIEIFKGRDGQETILAQLGPGEMFGTFGILGDGARTASARTLEDSELIEINAEQIHEALHQFPKWLSILVKDLVFRLNEINERYVDVKLKLDKVSKKPQKP